MISTIKKRCADFVASRRLAIALSMLMLAGIVIAATYRQFPAASSNTRWLEITPQLLENRLGLVGRIEAGTRQTLAAPFEGLIKQVAVVEGQHVDQNQLLLTLDTSQLDIQVRQAKAELLKARRTVIDMNNWDHGDEVARARRAVSNDELNLSDTEAKLADTKRLFERGIVARMEVEALEQQCKLLKLNLSSLQAELRAAQDKGKGENRQIAEMELSNAQTRYEMLQALQTQRELRAPFAGIVLRPQRTITTANVVLIQAGQRILQGAAVFELISQKRLQIVARIEETDLHQVQEGMPVQITGDGFTGLSINGKIASIGAQAIPAEMEGGGVTYEIIVTVDPLNTNQQQLIRLGMSARLAILTYSKENGIAIPVEALQHDDSLTPFVVHRANMNEEPRRIHVTIGKATLQGLEVFGMPAGYVEIPVR